MSKLRVFTVQAEAEARWARNRDRARSSLLPVGSAYQRGVRQREPDDDSPRCKTRRAMSPRIRCPCVFRGCFFTSASLAPLRWAATYTAGSASDADKDFVPSANQSIVVAPPENPAFPPASRTSSRSLDLDAISSVDFRSSDSALRASPVSMVDPEPAVMPVHSSDSDPDLVDELLQPITTSACAHVTCFCQRLCGCGGVAIALSSAD